MYLAQQCFSLSDEAFYDSQEIRHFVGIELNREAAPDARTLLKFRHLLEEYKLGALKKCQIAPANRAAGCAVFPLNGLLRNQL